MRALELAQILGQPCEFQVLATSTSTSLPAYMKVVVAAVILRCEAPTSPSSFLLTAAFVIGSVITTTDNVHAIVGQSKELSPAVICDSTISN